MKLKLTFFATRTFVKHEKDACQVTLKFKELVEMVTCYLKLFI